ncbi:MAG: hypothetical protein WCG25_08110 [bacterium]
MRLHTIRVLYTAIISGLCNCSARSFKSKISKASASAAKTNASRRDLFH